jgi:Zn-dependent alcohol dehydrogenases
MKAWRLNGPEQLEMISDTSASVDNPSLVKVKIEMCDLSYTDKINYDKGTSKPTILGRHGVGLISEVFDENCFLKKSDRVVIDPMMPCGNCFDCKTGNNKNCMYKYRLGVNCDGLQTDFITLPIESVHKLPLTIPFETAMFTEYVAMAINIINKIDIEKGDHVAILASNKIGNIVGQLVAYYQGIPVIIDDNESALTAARDAGVNYTFNTNKSDVVDEVFSITGGRMCEKSRLF